MTTKLVFLDLAFLGILARAQGFGEGRFGPPPDPATEPQRLGWFFYHQQELKLALLGALLLGALTLILLRRFRLRPLFLILSVAVLGFGMGGFLCPTAAVQNVFLKGVSGYLILFLLPVVAALFVGRIFCGYVCPFGALQELLHVRRWAWRVPPLVWRVLNVLRYAVLLHLVGRVLLTHTVILQDFSPFKPLFTFGGTPATLAFTVAFALLSVFTFRPFCRSLCPYGALLSLVSRVSFFHLQAGPTCASCGLCTKTCPGAAMRKGIPDAGECLLCGACGEGCPRAALRLLPRGRALKPREASGLPHT
ncbi:MAG: 4Fe-4S binding protein [Candidatus Bipolaricaulaceae bacterium]